MKAEDQYLKFVRWEDEDNCYIGYCPDLFPCGGVCHGLNEEQTYRELCLLVREEVEELVSITNQDNMVPGVERCALVIGEIKTTLPKFLDEHPGIRISLLHLDVDLYELPEAEAKKIKQVPGALDEALAALEQDHEFLLEGGVFTPDLLETWIDLKRRKEVDFVRMRPHPAEFYLYYDV